MSSSEHEAEIARKRLELEEFRAKLDAMRRAQEKPGYFTNAITLEQVREAKPEMIFYGALTCWWTHDPAHLGRLDNGIPCDPRGGVLMQTHKPEEFLMSAEEHPEHYGKHGLEAFMASHHLNCVLSAFDHTPTCFEGWDEYNRILDESR